MKEIAGDEGMTLCRSLLDGIEDDGDADLQGRIIEGRCTGKKRNRKWKGNRKGIVSLSCNLHCYCCCYSPTSLSMTFKFLSCCWLMNYSFLPFYVVRKLTLSTLHITFNVNVQCAWAVLTRMIVKKGMKSSCAMGATQRRTSGV